MKRFVAALTLIGTVAGVMAVFAADASATSGYMRRDGTYVAPYYRRP